MQGSRRAEAQYTALPLMQTSESQRYSASDENRFEVKIMTGEH